MWNVPALDGVVWHPKLYSEVIEHFKTYWSKERITALRKMKKKTTNNKVQHPVHQHDAWMSRSGEHQTTFGAPNCIEREADFDKQTVTRELEGHPQSLLCGLKLLLVFAFPGVHRCVLRQ